MANTASAKKQARKNIKRRVVNLNRMSALKTAIKKVVTAVQEKKSAHDVAVLFDAAQSHIARAANKGVLHANTARRKIGRLAKSIAQNQ